MERFYFDHNATTPVDAAVLEAMWPCFSEVYGNASSIHHFGQRAKQRLEAARSEVAALLSASPAEIVFTSGGTEADNLALLGAVRAAKRPQAHVVTTVLEHPAVLNTCERLQTEGVAVTFVAAGASGVVDPDDVRRALRPETVLISVMHANNELGTIQPVEQIGAIAREAGVLFHSDGVQAAGRLGVDAAGLGADYYAISGHKIYGPKGAGALYVRKGAPLERIAYGGHHERDRRPGTENVAGAAGLGFAAALAAGRLAEDGPRMAALRDRLEARVLAEIPGTRVNAGGSPRLPNTANLCFDGIEGEALLIALDLKGFAVSSGAACSSGSVEPSHVLLAIGLSREQARSSLRFSLGRSSTVEQVDLLCDALVAATRHLRRIAPSLVAANR